MRHGGTNKFSVGLNADSDLEFYNRATGAAQITLPIGGGVDLSGTPTCPTAAVGTDNTQIASTAYVQANAGGETSPTFLSQNNDSGTRLTFSGVGYATLGNPIDLRELTTDETNVICFTSHNSGAAHMGVQMPLLSTVTPGTKFTIRNLSANHNLYMNTNPSDDYQNFVIKWSATSPQVKSSPWSIGDSKRAIELFAYRTGSVGAYAYRWITVEIDTN